MLRVKMIFYINVTTVENYNLNSKIFPRYCHKYSAFSCHANQEKSAVWLVGKYN